MQRQINKKLKSIISIISCITLIVSLTPTYALEANTSGSKSTSEALLTAQPATFSVTVPTALPVNVDASGAITTATDAKITNNSPGPVKVVSCQMNTLNNWAITSEPSKAKVGAKEFNFTLNNKAFATDGNYDTSTWDSIFPNDNLPLVYTSEVSPQKNAVTEAMANIVFTVDWDKKLNAIHEVNKTKLSNSLRSTTGDISFRDSTEVPATYDTVTDVSTAGDGSVMAYIIGEDAIVQADGGVLAPVDASKMFYGYYATSLDLRWLDTSNVINMKGMFEECNDLSLIKFGSFDTSHVTDMSGMFAMCWSLTSLDLTSFNTSKVTDMSRMFYGNSLISLNLKSFDTSSVINMDEMFSECYNLISLDLSIFNTENLTTMEAMFNGCDGLISLDLSNFNTSKVTSLNHLFNSCDNLTTLDLSSFDFSKISFMIETFRIPNNVTVYVRTQADADILNSTESMDYRPEVFNIIVKSQ